jgi:hypothetical protein
VLRLLADIELDQDDRADILELLVQRLPLQLLCSILWGTPRLDPDMDWQWVDLLLQRLIHSGAIETTVEAIKARRDHSDRAWLLRSLAAQMPVLERDLSLSMPLMRLAAFGTQGGERTH